jgi:hypothetical protein
MMEESRGSNETELSELCCSQVSYQLSLQQFNSPENQIEHKDLVGAEKFFAVLLEDQIYTHTTVLIFSGTDPPDRTLTQTKQKTYKLHNSYLC